MPNTVQIGMENKPNSGGHDSEGPTQSNDKSTLMRSAHEGRWC